MSWSTRPTGARSAPRPERARHPVRRQPIDVLGHDAVGLARTRLRRRIEDGDLLVFSKTNAYSTVHRRARMDYIGVRHVSPDGEIVGEARMIGLFTSKAYMEPAAKTPLCTTSSNRCSRQRI
jgi:NAD-specific glutamate dehydrogenase